MTTVHQLKRQARDERLGQKANVAGGMIAPGAVLVLALLSIGGLAISMSYFSYDVWAAFWIAPVLMLLCIPIANHAARIEDDAKVGRFILAAAFVKVVVGASARFATLEIAYDGGGDSERYHAVGGELARQLRVLDYSDLGKISGTRFVEVLTGQIYVFTGASEFGGFLVFSFLAFLGMYGFYQAFRPALPARAVRPYRWLLFFMPTMWFWPSSTGKEAWMILCLGGATYGISLLVRGRPTGVLLALLGSWGAVVVRPHLGLVLGAGAVAALISRYAVRERSQRPDRSAVGKLVVFAGSLGLVTLALVTLPSRVEALFGLDDLDAESAEEALAETTRRTAQGGSEFDAPDPASPLGYGAAVVTVLFRPFPTESPGPQGLATAMEGLVLLLLMANVLLHLPRFGRDVIRPPMLAFAVVYTGVFVYAFAAIENFGILSRQRAQVAPMVAALIAVAWSYRAEPRQIEKTQAQTAVP